MVGELLNFPETRPGFRRSIVPYVQLLPVNPEAKDTMITAFKLLGEVVTNLMAQQRKRVFFNIHPKLWKEVYIKSVHHFDDTTIHKIQNYILICKGDTDKRHKKEQ
eukprot:jgi/Psemu1/19034/gm1.19034_g